MTRIDYIKANVRIEDEIGRDETLTPRNGDEWKGAHSALHGSVSGECLNVNISKQTFNCHSCDSRGSVIDYVMDRDNVPFLDACTYLAEAYHLTLPDDDRTPEEREAHKQAYARRKDVAGLLNSAAAFYHAQLTPEAVAYYEGRGITHETMTALQLGYAGPNKRALLNHLYQFCEEKETLLATGLFFEKEGKLYDTFQSRYVLPYWRNAKQVCYFIGRDALGNDKRAKYKSNR